MDKSQAEAAAEAILAQARAARPKLRGARRRSFTTGERRVMAILAGLGLIVGSVGAYLGLDTPGWAVIGAELGVAGGLVVASLVIWVRRVRTRS